MPRPLKPRKTGKPPLAPRPARELLEALSLAGLARPRIAELLGVSVGWLDDHYHGSLKSGPKMPAARVAKLITRLVELAEEAQDVADIPHVLAVVRLLAGLHLPELHAAQATPKPVEPPGVPPLFVSGPGPADEVAGTPGPQ